MATITTILLLQDLFICNSLNAFLCLQLFEVLLRKLQMDTMNLRGFLSFQNLAKCLECS